MEGNDRGQHTVKIVQGVSSNGFNQFCGDRNGEKARKEEILQKRQLRRLAEKWNYLLTGKPYFLSSDSDEVARIGLTMFSSFLTVQILIRDCQVIRETKENQITELKKICEQSTESLNNDWEKKVSYIRW